MSLQSLVPTIAAYWQRVQTTLFPYLETAGIPLTPELQHLVAILDLVRIEELVPRRRYPVGNLPSDRGALARAFLAKHVLNQPDTSAFLARVQSDAPLRRICGWATLDLVPSASTFSRAFAVFADLGLADLVHEQRLKEWLGDTLVWQQALDATDIAARETPQPNPPPQYGRTASGKRRKHPLNNPAPAPGEAAASTRLDRQLTQVPEIALLEIPTACDTGCKRDTHGYLRHWVGYKFHVVTNDWGLPLCAVTTAASVHDSQVAIPLLQLTARRVTALYDLMDRGYAAAAIRACSTALGHVPILPAVSRPGHPAPPLEPDRARQYAGRTVAERFNARLKDEAGGTRVRVRGHRKVHAHLMFGLLAIFADVLLRLAG